MTEVKATIAAIRADIDKVKVNVKENNQNQHQTGPTRKVDLGILQLLETLTLVSNKQNKQMEKIRVSMRTKPNVIYQMWNQVEQKRKETKDQMKALSIKVDKCSSVSENEKEDTNYLKKSNQHQKGYRFHDFELALSNISQKVSI